MTAEKIFYFFRSFWNTVFSCTARKICYGAKELFITLFQYVFLDTKGIIYISAVNKE